MTRPLTVLWFLLAAGMPLTAEAEPIHVNVDNYFRAESNRQLDELQTPVPALSGHFRCIRCGSKESDARS